MSEKRDEIIAELRRLAALSTDAERERKILDLAERMETGEDVSGEFDELPLGLG